MKQNGHGIVRTRKPSWRESVDIITKDELHTVTKVHDHSHRTGKFRQALCSDCTSPK